MGLFFDKKNKYEYYSNMNSILIAIVYIIFVFALHTFLMENYPVIKLPGPIKNLKMEEEPKINKLIPETFTDEIDTSEIAEAFKSEEYMDPLKHVNPDYSELDKYYSDLNNETYNFEPVPLLNDNTDKKFKTKLLDDTRSNLNHEIVYDNIMAFEDFDANYSPL